MYIFYALIWILIGLYFMGQLETYVYVQRQKKGFDDTFFKFTKSMKCTFIIFWPITLLCLILFPLVDLIHEIIGTKW